MDKEIFLEEVLRSRTELPALFKHVQVLRETFWQRLWSQYLDKQRFPFVKAEKRYSKMPEIGEICIIWDNGPRNGWKKGVILELIKSSDSQIRAAKVKTEHGILIRPLKLLYSLEMKETDTWKRSYHIEKAIHLDKISWSNQPQISVEDPNTLPHKQGGAGSADKKDGIGTDFMINPVEDLNIQCQVASKDVRTAKLDALGKIKKIVDYEKEKGIKKNR